MPGMRSPLTVETRRRLYEEDSKWPAKAILRVVAACFALVATILFAVAISFENMNFSNTAGNGDWTDGLALAPAVLSFLYNITTLILHFFVRRGRHFHPAWHIVGDFFVWGLSIPALIFAVGGGIFWYWAPAVPSQNGSVDCAFFFNAWAPACNAVAYTIGNLEIAGIVMLFLVLSLTVSSSIIHITLFAFACVDAHKWRKDGKLRGMDKKEFELQYPKDPEQQSYTT
ncbi:hypothetical protein MMC18_008158 [Xylographa bjoerkii]|nr:hypothetical protein [Xylographa bjoerkii]